MDGNFHSVDNRGKSLSDLLAIPPEEGEPENKK